MKSYQQLACEQRYQIYFMGQLGFNILEAKNKIKTINIIKSIGLKQSGVLEAGKSPVIFDS